jgi:amino acid transporter
MRTTELAGFAHRGLSATASTTLPGKTTSITAKSPTGLPGSNGRVETSARTSGRALPRRLGAWSTAAAMMGLMIGSGIFVVPALVAANVGSVTGIVAVWTLGGILALCGALTFAELGAMFPTAGGLYVFLRESYGRLPAFLYGWTNLLLLRPASTGAMALIFAAYASHIFGLDASQQRWLACGVIAIVTLFNYRSVVLAAGVENVMTSVKVLSLVGIAVVALILGNRADGALATSTAPTMTHLGGFALAVVTVMWTYSGWASVTKIAGEVRDPGRNLPRAMIYGVVTVIVAYLAINAAYLYLLPLNELAASSAVAADAVSRILGSSGAIAVAGIVMVSTFGAILASTMFGPRTYYAMAQDGLLFGRAGKLHPRYDTPHVATLLAATLGITYVSFQTFEQLAGLFVLGTWPFHVAAVAAVFVLRRKRPELKRPYRTWGYPVVPAIFMVVSIVMLVSVFFKKPTLAATSVGILLLGVGWYYVVVNERLRGLLRRRNLLGALARDAHGLAGD